MKKRILSLFFAALLILLPFAVSSCGKKKVIAMEYDGVQVTEEMLAYWFSHYKSVYINNYDEVSDTDAFWDSVVADGMTAEEYFNEVTLENIKKNIAAAWLFGYMGMKFTGDMKKEIKNGISDTKEYFSSLGDDFDEVLAEYGLTEDDLYDVYVMDSKISSAYNLLYGSGGAINISDSDKMIYANENYVHIEHLYINNLFKYTTVENEIGTFTHDPETGEAYTEKLSDTEKAEKDAAVASVRQGLEDGRSFEELWDEYSEDKLYSDGYYLDKDSTFIKEIVDAAFEMEFGEVRILETDYGFHVIKRYEIEGSPWDDSANDDFFEDFDTELADYVFTVMLEETVQKVTVYDDIVGKYSVRNSKPISNSYF